MRRLFTISAIVIVSFIILAVFAATLLTDWMWFGKLGFQDVMLTSLLSSLGLRVLTGIFFFVVFLLNLLILGKSIHGEPEVVEGENVVPLHKYVFDRIVDPKRLKLMSIIISAVLAVILSSLASNQWLMVQQFLHQVSFGITEPIFHRDASFYVFTLPFLRFVYSIVFTALLLSLLMVGVSYFLLSSGNLLSLHDGKTHKPKVHLSILLALIFIAKTFGYALDAFNLLNKSGGVVYGPGYADIHATLLGLKVLAVISAAAAIVVLFNIFRRRFRLVLFTVGFLVVASILFQGVYPYVVQKVFVEPNELAKETPYIQNNIELTREAYGLNDVKLDTFEANPLTLGQVEDEPGTVNNIRLWDPRPLKDANAQLQTIRSYYNFIDVDVDRYMINGQLTQVMASARELDKKELPEQSQTWVNSILRYTHGYGITMNYVHRATQEGHPDYIIKDIPPASSADNLQVKQPGIYYGEADEGYVIVKSKSEEFDYPAAAGNVSTTYEGTGGVPISNLLTRALFAARFGDYRILISDAITKDSRVIFNKNIQDRVRTIAPFLQYDHDPYVVLVDGRLFWIQDAYTTTASFPYSTPVSGAGNYVRNSVKIVIDAYNGDVTFYADNSDPIVKSLGNVFPSLFKPMSEMPDNLRAHVRYPEDLFRIQSQVYATYHMTNIRDFYNKEDVWTVPQEIFAGEATTMDPYYTIMTLPGETQPEYVLMLPFTPTKKNNMAAWLAVRCDPEHYGDKIVYQFSKQKLVYGPIQVESEIDADPTISQNLSLWSQRGSQVIRGNMLVIPVKDGLIYVEPLFLQAEQSKLPILRKVIVFHDGDLAWGDTLSEALTAVFAKGQQEGTVPEPGTGNEVQPAPSGPIEGTASELISRANELFQQAKQSQQQGDWAGYGKALNELEAVLNQLSQTQ